MESYRSEEIDTYPAPDEWELFPYINNTTIYENLEVIFIIILSHRFGQQDTLDCLTCVHGIQTNTV